MIIGRYPSAADRLEHPYLSHGSCQISVRAFQVSIMIWNGHFTHSKQFLIQHPACFTTYDMTNDKWVSNAILCFFLAISNVLVVLLSFLRTGKQLLVSLFENLWVCRPLAMSENTSVLSIFLSSSLFE